MLLFTVFKWHGNGRHYENFQSIKNCLCHIFCTIFLHNLWNFQLSNSICCWVFRHFPEILVEIEIFHVFNVFWHVWHVFFVVEENHVFFPKLSIILQRLFLGISFWKVILRQSGGSKFQIFSLGGRLYTLQYPMSGKITSFLHLMSGKIVYMFF